MTIELTQDQFDTLYEAASYYIETCEENIKKEQGNQMRFNFWMNELDLAKELFEKIKNIETEDEE